MTPTISPVTGALPQQPAPTTMNCAAPAPPALASSPAAAVDPTVPPAGGGAVQAAQGAMQMAPEQLVPILQELVGALTKLVAAMQQQGIVGGGPGGSVGQVGQCGMAGCTMDHAAPTQSQPTQGGANGGVTAEGAKERSAPGARSSGTARAASPAPTNVQRVSASSVKDKTSTSGLTGPSIRGLEEAHTFGLPLVSGKRSGGGSSDHDHGNAIDVGTLPIGVASSDGGTPQMKAFADHMREQGKAGKLDVKYVIADGRIASATNDWAWRPYTYPGKSQGELDALKRSNPGEYNRIQHFDHVHVSFG